MSNWWEDAKSTASDWWQDLIINPAEDSDEDRAEDSFRKWADEDD